MRVADEGRLANSHSPSTLSNRGGATSLKKTQNVTTLCVCVCVGACVCTWLWGPEDILRFNSLGAVHLIFKILFSHWPGLTNSGRLPGSYSPASLPEFVSPGQ